ncbi:hypothetical protein SK571_13505 [Lentzea sp. BCCO 10_0798]|uniref:Phage protein, HK97 gp10 family n=1 Tax=Lentzea kristufekii TaxID=3095430 RepID=A0ABU4TQA2_9PSEU|nr:hypothetical protein [Lentzea sp. BCCO 10_0798]MDX8050402.1 hypothetical protein [Lentzea sp. BCCO 10_0798]
MPVEMSFDEKRLVRLARAMRSEEDGKALRKDMLREFRAALNPTRNSVRAAIRAMPTKGHAGMKLRSKVAAKVMVQIRPTGKFPGATLKAKKTPNVRKFRNAPKRLNQKSFQRPMIGNPRQRVRQVGAPGWFDKTVRARRGAHRRAARNVIKAAEKRLKRKV